MRKNGDIENMKYTKEFTEKGGIMQIIAAFTKDVQKYVEAFKILYAAEVI